MQRVSGELDTILCDSVSVSDLQHVSGELDYASIHQFKGWESNNGQHLVPDVRYILITSNIFIIIPYQYESSDIYVLTFMVHYYN